MVWLTSTCRSGRNSRTSVKRRPSLAARSSRTEGTAVPPEKRVLGVAVEPNAERSSPAKKRRSGRARRRRGIGRGQTVVTVYDKSLEYISGSATSATCANSEVAALRQLSSVDNLSYGAPETSSPRLSGKVMDRLQPVGVFGNEFPRRNGRVGNGLSISWGVAGGGHYGRYGGGAGRQQGEF